MPTPIKKGTPAIIWGSSNALGTPTGAIVESVTVTNKNGGPIEIEDNDGFAAVLVYLDGELDVSVKCVYDSAKTWPAVGDIVVMQLPKVGAAGGLQNFNCYCAKIDPEMARKKEAMLTIDLNRRPGVLA